MWKEVTRRHCGHLRSLSKTTSALLFHSLLPNGVSFGWCGRDSWKYLVIPLNRVWPLCSDIGCWVKSVMSPMISDCKRIVHSHLNHNPQQNSQLQGGNFLPLSDSLLQVFYIGFVWVVWQGNFLSGVETSTEYPQYCRRRITTATLWRQLMNVELLSRFCSKSLLPQIVIICGVELWRKKQNGFLVCSSPWWPSRVRKCEWFPVLGLPKMDVPSDRPWHHPHYALPKRKRCACVILYFLSR